MDFADVIKVPMVKNALWQTAGGKIQGTMVLTAHHIIFSSAETEIMVRLTLPGPSPPLTRLSLPPAALYCH